ncbi:MAG: hypothetical protein ACHQJ6_07240 [Candidatus Berkiellales bacterium]
MKLINNSDLNKISGATTNSSYMCIYSLIQYQNSRFTMLDHAYQGNSAEEPTPGFNSDKESFAMYRKWADQYCPQEIVAEYIGK